MPDDASVAPASDGRIPGPRGLATRNRLIECTAAIVATTPYSDLRVTDVARAAGTSPATFYQYFVDLDAALLVLATQTTEIGAQLAGFIQNRRWRGKAGYTTARELVDGFLDFWQAHLPVLRVVDLLTEEGDARFRQARVKMLNGITTALADAIATARPDGSAAGDRPDGDGERAGVDAGPRRRPPRGHGALAHRGPPAAGGHGAPHLLGREQPAGAGRLTPASLRIAPLLPVGRHRPASTCWPAMVTATMSASDARTCSMRHPVTQPADQIGQQHLADEQRHREVALASPRRPGRAWRSR